MEIMQRDFLKKQKEDKQTKKDKEHKIKDR